MKKFLLVFNITILMFLSTFFSACSTNTQPAPTQYIYVNKPIPEIENKPIPHKYNSYMVKFNNEEYYVMSKADFMIMQSNWVSFKNWAITNHDILIELKK